MKIKVNQEIEDDSFMIAGVRLGKVDTLLTLENSVLETQTVRDGQLRLIITAGHRHVALEFGRKGEMTVERYDSKQSGTLYLQRDHEGKLIYHSEQPCPAIGRYPFALEFGLLEWLRGEI